MIQMLMGLVFAVSPCPDVAPPVPAPPTAAFAPVGDYAGHWGVDFGTGLDTTVKAVSAGTVTFAGSVAGRRSVSVDHGRGLMTTVSYLSTVSATRGDVVDRGEAVGQSGIAHGAPAVHLSLRIDGLYSDPMGLFACQMGPISDALRLVPTPD